MSRKEIIFFANGVAAVFHDGQQQPLLQQSWLELFAEFLESRGQDPARYRLTMPNGAQACFHRTADGWTWKFDSGEPAAEADAAPAGGEALRELAHRMNSATPEQIAQAMEQMPTDALEFGVKFEGLSHPPDGGKV